MKKYAWFLFFLIFAVLLLALLLLPMPKPQKVDVWLPEGAPIYGPGQAQFVYVASFQDESLSVFQSKVSKSDKVFVTYARSVPQTNVTYWRAEKSFLYYYTVSVSSYQKFNWNDLWWWYGVIYEDGSLYLVPHFRGWALLVPAILLVAAWYNWPKKE
ncbi:MAG: hypothetical protein Q8N56_02230, partial [bacterium]|nr:hypothetical protein [bacterium]